MNSLQTALIRANLSTIQHVVESRHTTDNGINDCRKNVVRCNTAKKLKYCCVTHIGGNNA